MMSTTSTVSRSLHDAGLAAWFGGTLANAVALNPATAEAGSSEAAGAVANAAWNRWTPVNAAAIGAHLIGSVGQLADNFDRVRAQKGVAAMSVVKTSLTIGALAATGWARLQGRKVAQQPAVPLADATTPHPTTPQDVSDAQRQLSAMQWVIPALTGALVVVSAFAGEQQRPRALLSGIARQIAV
jgi:hypothetical protein